MRSQAEQRRTFRILTVLLAVAFALGVIVGAAL